MFEKNRDIPKEMKQLKKIIKLIPKDRQAIANNIYNELLFIQRTLDKAKQEVDEKGVTTLFKQGQQEFIRENPALKGYNTTIKNYSCLYKQLIDMLPESEKTEQDPFIDFVKENN